MCFPLPVAVFDAVEQRRLECDQQRHHKHGPDLERACTDRLPEIEVSRKLFCAQDDEELKHRNQ
jgi:hypothetical protein